MRPGSRRVDNKPVATTGGAGAAWVFARRTLTITAPAAAVAGVPVSINVLAEEPNNVVRADNDGNLSVTSTDPKAVLPMNPALTQGVGTFVATFQTPGIQTITADYGPSPLVSGTSNTISVRVAAVEISPANLTLGYTAGTDPSSGVAATLSVAADAAISFTAANGNSWIVLSPASGTVGRRTDQHSGTGQRGELHCWAGRAQYGDGGVRQLSWLHLWRASLH